LVARWSSLNVAQMGVPRLFRVLVERYPLILRNVNPNPSLNPSFDNFYVDFNGMPLVVAAKIRFFQSISRFAFHDAAIVHTCTHGEDDEEVSRSEEVDRDLSFSVACVLHLCH
jgi:5'-3' exonuclease